MQSLMLNPNVFESVVCLSDHKNAVAILRVILVEQWFTIIPGRWLYTQASVEFLIQGHFINHVCSCSSLGYIMVNLGIISD